MELIVSIKRALRSTTWILLCGNLVAQTERRDEIQLHYERAQEAMRRNKPDTATQEFREILRLDPGNPEAQANLGVIAFTQAKYSEAARAFHEALKHDPSLWSAKAFLGLIEVRMGRARQGQALLEESFPHLQNARLRRQVGMCLIRVYYQAGDLSQVESILHPLQQDDPTDVDVLYISYRAYLDLAARALASLSEVAPESARMHQILGQALAARDNFPAAITQYRKAIEIDPRLPGLHYELGKTVLLNSRDELARQQAQEEFEAELASNPANSNSEYALGEIYRLRSNFEAALQHESRALELRPDFAEAHIALAKILTTMGEPEKALEHLLESARIDPENEVAHHDLALSYRRLGRIDDADREQATFERLRNSDTPVRSFRLPGSVSAETIEESEPQ